MAIKFYVANKDAEITNGYDLFSNSRQTGSNMGSCDVMEVYAVEGNYYKEGQPLYKVSDLRKVWVQLDAYESQVPFIKKNQDIKIYIKSLNSEILGKVDVIEPMVDTRTRAMTVRVELENDLGILKPGMFVEGYLKTKSLSESSIVIPKSAVLWTGKRSVVYKKVDMEIPVFEMVTVLLGHELEDSFEVLQGIEPGDMIVVNGVFTLDAAAQLKGKRSMMHFDDELHNLNNKHTNGIKERPLD